jgi:hypothetical protein
MGYRHAAIDEQHRNDQVPRCCDGHVGSVKRSAGCLVGGVRLAFLSRWCRGSSVNSAPSSIPGFWNGRRSRDDSCADVGWQVEALQRGGIPSPSSALSTCRARPPWCQAPRRDNHRVQLVSPLRSLVHCRLVIFIARPATAQVGHSFRKMREAVERKNVQPLSNPLLLQINGSPVGVRTAYLGEVVLRSFCRSGGYSSLRPRRLGAGPSPE